MALKSLAVFTAIRTKILSGEWPESYRIPTEMELCRLFGVSRVTVRHALSLLVSEGMVSRTRGKGSYVISRKEVVGKPSRGSAYEYRILLREKIPASPADLRQIVTASVSSGWPKLWHLRILRLKEGRPSVISDYFVTEQLGSCLPSVSATPKDSLFSIIGRCLGQPCHFADGIVACVIPSDAVCILLRTAPGSAHFWCRGLCKLGDGTVVGRSSHIFDGSQYEFAFDHDFVSVAP
jgi:DNA-binding GntR family transcriptional regulator